VVDEDALYDALISERIHGAGLDVMVEEPPAPEPKLFTLPNIILTPHLAGPSWENGKKAFRNSFDNIERVARGEKHCGSSPSCAAEPDASIFRSPRLRQAECRHLLATQDLRRCFEDCGVESRRSACDPFAERLDHRLRHGDAGEPFKFGGSFSHSGGSWSATNRYGGTASGGGGSWSVHSAYGGSVSGGGGSWSASGGNGAAASGGGGWWSANSGYGGGASGGGGSWSATGRYSGTACGGAAYHGGYYGGGYGGYHGAYYGGTTVFTPGYTGAGVAAGAVAGAAVGALATSAAYAAASTNYYPPPYYAPPPW
jgi:hypothetical protein